MNNNRKKIIANNKKVFHDYFVEQTFEAGIVLTGTEIKSARAGKISIKESYARITKLGELMIYGMHIAPYSEGNRFNVDPLRERKLLLHRREIDKITGMIKLRGYTIIPLSVYINKNGLCKIELGICKGKKIYDKRDAIHKKEIDRKIDRAIKEKLKG